MNLAFLIYIADVLANIDGLAWFAFFAAGIIGVLLAILKRVTESGEKSHAKSLITLMTVCALIGTFVPDKTTIYMMVGAQLVQNVAESPEAERISDRLLVLVETKLDEAIRQAQPSQEPNTPEEE